VAAVYDVYDTIIIGIGAAGLSAALFTSRAQLKTLVVGQKEKSMTASVAVLGNYVGLEDEISGPDFLDRGMAMAKKYGAEVIDAEVVHAWQKNGTFGVKLADGREFETKTLIFATGTAYKLSAAKREKELTGKGVHYCVACDGVFYKNKRVAVIGNGNYAAEEAIELTSFTKDITIFSQGKKWEVSPQLLSMLKKAGIKMREEKVTEFKGEKKLEAVSIGGKDEKFDGVFVAIGTATALAFADKLGLLKEGDFLKIDRDGKTNVDGVYAAGACTGGNVQIAKSVGEGCNAAISVIKKLKGLGNYVDHT